MKIKVLVITDSLGLPRDTPEKVEYNETWTKLLHNKFCVHQLSIGGGTIDLLTSQIHYLRKFNPNFVIVQAGIVDSAPRALTKCELKIVKKYSLLSNFFKRKKVLNFLRKYRGLSYTSEKKFYKCANELKEMFGEKLYWVEILKPNSNYENHLPGIKNKVIIYNSIISKVVKDNLIKIKNFSELTVMSDMIHLSKSGHSALYESIESILSVNNKKI